MPRRILVTTAAAAVLVTAGLSACGSTSSPASSSGSTGDDVTINGAGSTFAAPIYQQIGSELKSKGITVNYQSIGSGAGVAQFTARTVDFAGSDPALKDDEIAALKHGTPTEVPIAFGAITVSYNVPGIKRGLKLDGRTLADIYLGRVKAWNAAAIAKLNPGLKLPATRITVVHRSDSSGTTKGFTDFLSRYSPTWKTKVGVDKDVKWPAGTGAKGNEGVAAAVKQTAGAVGYVEQAYALQNGFTFADVENRSGKFVAPTLASTSAAGRGITVPADLRINIIDSPNPAAYPISSQTFAIVLTDLCKGGLSKAEAKGVAEMLSYIVGQGQATIRRLSYAPLPAGLKAKARAAIGRLTCDGAAIGAS